MFVKKFFIPIAICALLCAANIAGGNRIAFAEGTDETYYPEQFLGDAYEDLGEICDFAVSEKGCAVTDKQTIVVIENDYRTVYENLGSDIVALDYADGVYYYADSGDNAYALPDKAETEHEFIYDAEISTAKFLYYKQENNLKVYNKESETTATLENYTRVKQYGEAVYALHGGKIQILNGAETSEKKLKYIDFKDANNILTGNTAQLLKCMGNPVFIKIGDNCYKTEIDLDKLYKPAKPDGEPQSERYFTAGETAIAAAGETALLLCYTGNAAVISIGEKAYITMKSSVTEIPRSVLERPEFENAAVCTPFDYIYSSPYACESTKLVRVNFDDEVKILDKVKSGELLCDFYKVEFADETSGETVTGYIPCSFLRETQIKDVPQITTPDPDYTEENVKQTVILVIVLVALVLAAIGYLTYIITAGRKKPKKDEKKK